MQQKFPGIKVEKKENKGLWKVQIPESYRVGHEAHFKAVTEIFLQYLSKGGMPKWEVPNMISKYYVTTKALEMATERLPHQIKKEKTFQ